MKPRILTFAGSARAESVNKKLARFAASRIPENQADVTVLDLADFPLPLYDQDLEARDGLPEKAKELKTLMNDSHAFLIACPEYNSSIPPLLKNVIDWCSRPASDDEPILEATTGKVVGLMAASPGGLGGLRVLRHVREIYGNIGAIVLPEQVAVGGAYDSFDDQGQLTDDSSIKRVEALVQRLIEVTSKLRG